MPNPQLKLNSGHEMPQVGFGLWKVDNDVAADTVYNAIKAGYRMLDGACDYGNEKECGDGVQRALKEGIVKREELFITSKLWQSFHDGDRVEQIARKQLADWGIEYFDLFLIHFPVATQYVDPSVRYPPGWKVNLDDAEPTRSRASTQETWTAMEGLVEKGIARSIGVSNFQAQLVYDLLTYAKIRPACLQIEHHPYLVQPELVRMAQHEGMVVTAYSSFGPSSFLEFEWDHMKEMTPLLKEPTITKLAEKYGKGPGQILLRWATQRGLAVIPKTVGEKRMYENLDCTSFDMEKADIDTISGLDKNMRFNKPTHYFSSEKVWIFG